MAGRLNPKRSEYHSFLLNMNCFYTYACSSFLFYNLRGPGVLLIRWHVHFSLELVLRS